MKKVAVIVSFALVSFAALTFGVLYFEESRKVESTIDTLSRDMISIERLASTSSAPSNTTLVEAVTKLVPSVVRLEMSGSGFRTAGSGFIITNTGYVITNHHVIEHSTSINAILSGGESYSATLVDDNPDRDLALLKLNSSRSDFPEVGLATAAEAKVGTEVMAVGFPLGLELSGPASVTSGIISAFRSVNGLPYIQTDAAINSGNSGGPLVDAAGQVVGVCTARITDAGSVVEGMNLAIPISDALAFLADGHVACSDCHQASVPTRPNGP